MSDDRRDSDRGRAGEERDSGRSGGDRGGYDRGYDRGDRGDRSDRDRGGDRGDRSDRDRGGDRGDRSDRDRGDRRDRDRSYSPRRRDRSFSPARDRRDHDRRRGRSRSRSLDGGRRRARSPSPEVLDEFGRVVPKRRASPGRRRSPGRDRRDSRSPSQDRRKRKDRKKEKKAAAEEVVPDYRDSLYPPGADLALYTYDAASYWHMTPDRVWYYRPDLTLWYDCRHETYYTYDATSYEYVTVDKERATTALTECKSVAPMAYPVAQQVAAEAEADEEAAADGEEPLIALGPSLPNPEEAAAAAAIAAAQSGGADEGEEEEREGEAVAAVDAEDKISRLLLAHTESWQGKKDTNEDRYIQSHRMGKLGTSFGVFDGHGGTHAAEYVTKHLPNNITRCHMQRPSSSRRESDVSSHDTKRLTAAMEEAFPLTDSELLSVARRKKYTDGTTALVVLVHGTEREELSLFCAHVGDCRAVLCRDGLAYRLTQDHRPDRKDEQLRIRAAGGGVFQVAGIWRCTSAARPNLDPGPGPDPDPDPDIDPNPDPDLDPGPNPGPNLNPGSTERGAPTLSIYRP